MDMSNVELEQLRLQIGVLEKDNKAMQTVIDDMRLKLQYALFDAEAANREVSYLRKLLNDKNE